MFWGPLILTVTGIFAAGVSFHLHKVTQRLKFLGLLLASIVFVIVELAVLGHQLLSGIWVEYIAEQVIEWGHIYCIALILSSLLLFVRDSKPEFTRFPLFYGLLPLIIIISYILVYDTVLLKNWLMNIYQGGAVVVTLLICGVYCYRDKIYSTVAVGATFFLLTYIFYLFIPVNALIWQVCLAVSIIIMFSGYLIVEKEYLNQ